MSAKATNNRERLRNILAVPVNEQNSMRKRLYNQPNAQGSANSANAIKARLSVWS